MAGQGAQWTLDSMPLLVLGEKMTTITIEKEAICFQVHEDLLCNNAKMVKNLYQPNRKPVKGECAICHLDVIPEIELLSFCRGGCGKNMHGKCLKSWFKTKTEDDEPLTCPYCRKDWKCETEVQHNIHCLPPIGADVLALYVGWLYSGGRLQVGHTNMPKDSEDFTIYLLNALSLAYGWQDDRFKYAVLKAIINETHGYPEEGAITWVYENFSGFREMRELMVDMSLAWASSEGTQEKFKAMVARCPKAFLQDVTTALLKLVGQRIDKMDLLRKYTPAQIRSYLPIEASSPTVLDSLAAQQPEATQIPLPAAPSPALDEGSENHNPPARFPSLTHNYVRSRSAHLVAPTASTNGWRAREV